MLKYISLNQFVHRQNILTPYRRKMRKRCEIINVKYLNPNLAQGLVSGYRVLEGTFRLKDSLNYLNV